MINRSLIRIKTIQILYSYLLTRRDFQLEPAPAPGEASKDVQFAYSVYLDMLALLVKLSGQHMGARTGAKFSDSVLEKNKVAKALRDDAAFNSVMLQNRERIAKLDAVVPELIHAISQTTAYGDYKRKHKRDMSGDIKFWNTIFTTTIRKNKSLERELRRDEAFTHMGFENGLDMFLRTLASFDNTRSSYLKARHDLEHSLDMAYSLYHALLYIPVCLTALQEQRLDAAKNKYIPSPEDLNPNPRFVNNAFVAALRNCEALTEYVDENNSANPADWRDGDIMLSALLDRIVASDLYAQYMETEAGDFATDATFWREVMRTIVIPSDELADALETKSVYWNDDMEIMSTFVLKTIRRSYAAADGDKADNAVNEGKIVLLPKFIDRDAEEFGAQLFEFVVADRETYRSYIDSFIDTTQWDTERLAFMDIVVMMTAIAEIIHYPAIPVPVSLNEYIQIANDYSTPRSGQFINGILFSVVKMLNQEGIINKPC